MKLRTNLTSRSAPTGSLPPLWLVVLALGVASVNPLRADEHGLRVPEGFQVSEFAGNDLASDIFSMTIDSQGRVVVSGPGYVRILIDADQDGRAESYKQFADGPTSGAQGMTFLGRDLICTGDDGILRFRDENGDDRADEAPELFVKIKARSEHDAHAVRRGPDGWWYVIAGNTAEVNENYIALASSPVRHPRNGTVLRFRPDLSAGEVIAHGYRNAYDFDFNAEGDILTFDSDGEREISLPAYQPTRVFHVAPGSHAGWMSDHWKRPGEFFDMPAVVAEFGRASPTGVVCYRHTQFPEAYQGATFVLDWTFGRIFALPAYRSGSPPGTKEPIEFLSTIGDHGFAPTDVEVGPDGSLFVSVGGRGTRGAIYRITSRISSSPPAPAPNDRIAQCLDAPQPLSAWSRAKWEPVADLMGASALQKVVVDERELVSRRIRAIEILTERFKGLDPQTANRIVNSPLPAIRARLAWSLGRSRPDDPSIPLLSALLKDRVPFVQRAALEAALCADSATLDELAESVGATLGSPDRFVRMAGVRVLAKMSRSGFSKASKVATTKGAAAGIALAMAYSHRHPGYSEYSLDIARRILESAAPQELKLEATRLLEVSLGDVGARGEEFPEAFEGYTSRIDLSKYAVSLEPSFRAISSIFPTGHSALDRELGRAIAMLQPGDAALLAKVIAQITPDTSPVDDFHWLLVAGRINAPRTPEVTAAIATALLGLEPKIKSRQFLIDSHWDQQLSEVYAALVERDEQLGVTILKAPSFGRPAHIPFVEAIPIEHLGDVLAAFLRQAQADPDYPWNGDVIYLLSQSEDPEVQKLVRSKFDDYALRNAVLLTLSENPQESDRGLFLAGLTDSPAEIVSACLSALASFPPSAEADEQIALVRALRSLGDQGEELAARTTVLERLAANNGKSFGDNAADPKVVEQWVGFVQDKFPAQYAIHSGESLIDSQQLATALADTEWASGDAARGRKLFETRQCVQCHSGRGAVGPDLSGAAQRFSRDDLFTAIANPSRDVSPRYQTTALTTVEGRTYTGLIIYESVDYLVLRNASNQTSRIEKKNIEEQRTLSKSLMPEGLLKDLGPGDYADLYAYLRSMSATQTAEGGSPEAK